MKTKIKNMNLKQKIYIYNSILGTTSFYEYIEETKYADEPEIRNNKDYNPNCRYRQILESASVRWRWHPSALGKKACPWHHEYHRLW